MAIIGKRRPSVKLKIRVLALVARAGAAHACGGKLRSSKQAETGTGMPPADHFGHMRQKQEGESMKTFAGVETEQKMWNASFVSSRAQTARSPGTPVN